jgi:hypothetical protein
LGPVPERADSICCRGTVNDGTVTREFVLFRKRPNNIRIHIVENGLVVGVLAYNGVTAWRQVSGKPPLQIHGPEAESLISSSRFDDPLVGFRERGAKARLESAPGASPIRLRISEVGGSEVVETIDPSTYNELSMERRDSSGNTVEMRFRDYRKVGSLNFAGVQEEWINGVIHSTTRITEVRLDTGVLARIFAIPTNPNLDYLDLMGALQVLAKVSTKAGAGVQQPQMPSK